MAVPIAMCIDWLILGRNIRRVLRAGAVWIGIMIAALILARIAQGVEGIPSTPLWARPLIVADSITFYLGKLVYPVALGVDYGRRPEVVLSARWTYLEWLVPVAIALLMLSMRKRRPWLLAAGIIFVVAILPVSGIATFLFQFTSTTADHYLYLAMLAPAIALACLLREYDRPVLVVTACFALLLLAARSVMQTTVWRDDETLFSNALEVNPDSFVAHNNLGHWYVQHRDDDSAIDEFRAAIKANPDFPDAYGNLADALLRRGKVDEAIATIEKLIPLRARRPNYRDEERDRARLEELRLQRARGIGASSTRSSK
jgi:hypothetical protein